MAETVRDYKETLNLPSTSFPMRARLPEREPEALADWEERRLYDRLREERAGRERYVLHDGPPYANGHLHLGTAVNKIQKDFIVRTRSMMGYDAPYVPGWDCHGMPIEVNVMKEFGERGERPGLLELREACRSYAAEWVDVQRDEFRRLGVWGEWERPYLTMSSEYEAEIVETFADLVEDGYVYRGLRPIHWCPTCETALAEAEIEYHDKRSTWITARFPVREDPRGVFPADADDPAVLVWTTTPWTIPANLAVVVHPELEYVVVDTDRGTMLYAKGRHEALVDAFGKAEVVRTVAGRELEGLVFSHPLIDRASPLFLADHVTLEEGTGVVHTAPGHGAEDFHVGVEQGLEIYNPVGPDGLFLDDTPRYAGTHIWKANPRIVGDLEAEDALLESGELVHSYPHCWRCKNPVIFRATTQWFLSMDHAGLRDRTLEAIEEVEWLPPSTRNRITTMVEGRPDWCLSRQRAWGVGIPAVYCRACEEPLVDPAFVRRVADRIREEGADVWFTEGDEALVPESATCPSCDANDPGWRREVEILDVWFDSGVSQRAVLEKDPDLVWPCDLYHEGPDQHRGWFNSSLVLAMATRGAPPYRAVLTHGWTVDAAGRAMHKSLGNVVSPDEVIDKFGADILRLWTAASDLTQDRRFGWDTIDQIAEAYRRVRNTFRFLLGNLEGFDPVEDAVPLDELLPFDRWALAALERFQGRTKDAYEAHQFHVAYQRLVNYCAVELSGVYLDGLKVRLYTWPADSVERRSAQTVLHEVLQTLVRLMAPILPFTADEVWRATPGRDGAGSVHLAEFRPARPERREPAIERDWEILLAARQAVTRELETLRESKRIGSSLAAEVEIAARDEAAARVLERRADDLEEVFIVSAVRIRKTVEAFAGEAVEADEGFHVSVKPAGGEKCQRCWRWRPDVGDDSDHPTLCAECVAAVS